MLKFQKILYRSALKAIDGLLLIANNKDTRRFKKIREHRNQQVLGIISILMLIYVDVEESLLNKPEQEFVFFESNQKFNDEIVVVHLLLFFLFGFIARIDVCKKQCPFALLNVFFCFGFQFAFAFATRGNGTLFGRN